MAAPPWVWMTAADGVAVSVQRGLVLHASTGIIHVASMISGSGCALVHELMQPAIHYVDGKRRWMRWSWGVQYGSGCGLFAFDTKGPPFLWVAGPTAQAAPLPGPLSDGAVGVDWCPEDLLPCSHSGKGKPTQLLALPWEPEDPPTTSTQNRQML